MNPRFVCVSNRSFLRGRHWVLPAACALLGAMLVALPADAGNPPPEPGVLHYTFTFPEPSVQEVKTPSGTFTALGLPGTLNLGIAPGTPALPVKFVQVLLPPGKTVKSVAITGALEPLHAAADLSAHPVLPYQPPMPIGTPPAVELVMNEALYVSDTPYPGENGSEGTVGYCRGYALFSVGLYPVKYNPAQGTVQWFRNMKLEITLQDDPAPSPFFRNRKDDAAWVRRLVINPGMAQAYATAGLARDGYPGGICDPKDHYDYVIVTTTQNGLDHWQTGGTLPYNWDSLMDKHTQVDGLACTLVTVQEILACQDYRNPDPLFNDTPARIREFCKDAYLDWGTSYVLVGADAEWIPARLMDSSVENAVDADIYWNHLDNTFNDDHDAYWGEEGDAGFDLYGEFFIGRLTCDVPQDVSNWLNKNFYYMDASDRNYLDNAAFYGGDTTWSCEGDDFIDYSAIKGTDNWLGPDPSQNSYPGWLGFQYGFETWNTENPGAEYDMTVKWTAEPPNPGGWMGGSDNAAITGLRNAINADTVTLISGIAHANEYMSLDVYYSDWEALYHNTKPFFIHDYGCHCGDMDAADDGVLHSMLFHSDTELAFACVYNTGYGWGNYYNTCSSSALQQKSFWDYLFDVTHNSGHTDNWQLGKAQAFSKDLMAPTINWDGSWRECIQCCLLFGDPAVKIKPPEIPALVLSFPEGLPDGTVQPPGPATVMTVKIKAGKENYQPGTAQLHYRFDPASAYQTVPLTPMGSDLFEAVLPNTKPGDEPQFYFSAQGDGGTTVYAPWDAPASVYSFDVYFVETLFEDDFETDKGWTVYNDPSLQTGPFERADPVGTEAQPEDDHSPDGTRCYVTGHLGGSIGDHDVDGGPTILNSPEIDLSAGDGWISFFVWFYHSTNGTFQPLEIQLSNDGGATWTLVEDMGNSPSWNYRSYKVSDYVSPTAHVKIRFRAVDNPNDSVVEALVDDFSVERHEYDPALWADAYTLPVSTGGQVHFSMDADPVNGGRSYLLLGSLSGTTPGFPLPGGQAVPLNWDAFTNLIVTSLGSPAFQNFMGVLDGLGQATATFDTLGPLDPVFIGLTADFAYILGPPPGWNFVSNAIGVAFVP